MWIPHPRRRKQVFIGYVLWLIFFVALGVVIWAFRR